MGDGEAQGDPKSITILLIEGDGLEVLKDPLRLAAKDEARFKLLERIAARNTRR